MSRSNTIAFLSELSEAMSPASHAGLRVTATGRRFIRQRALPWLLLSSGALLALLNPGVTFGYAWVPFLVSLFIFGMPHGAMDWMVQNRLGGVHGLMNRSIAFFHQLASPLHEDRPEMRVLIFAHVLLVSLRLIRIERGACDST